MSICNTRPRLRSEEPGAGGALLGEFRFLEQTCEIFAAFQIQGNVSKPRRLYLGRKPDTVRTGKVTAAVARVSKRSQSLSVMSSDGSDQPALPGALPPNREPGVGWDMRQPVSPRFLLT